MITARELRTHYAPLMRSTRTGKKQETMTTKSATIGTVRRAVRARLVSDPALRARVLRLAIESATALSQFRASALQEHSVSRAAKLNEITRLLGTDIWPDAISEAAGVWPYGPS